MFFQWLLAQRGRVDDVGRFAEIAATDDRFPRRSHRLYKLLRHYDREPEMRRALKTAHREWRLVR